jgi:hypothetical protein
VFFESRLSGQVGLVYFLSSPFSSLFLFSVVFVFGLILDPSS